MLLRRFFFYFEKQVPSTLLANLNFSASQIGEMEEFEKKTLQWSALGKEVVETLLSMIEGRTDSAVHNKILAVVQPRNLKQRLSSLKEMIESGLFKNRTERILTGEGVEIMNLLMTLSEHDQILYKQIMLGNNQPYW